MAKREKKGNSEKVGYLNYYWTDWDDSSRLDELYFRWKMKVNGNNLILMGSIIISVVY